MLKICAEKVIFVFKRNKNKDVTRFPCSEVQEITSEEEEEEEEENEQTNDTETSSCYADSARSTPIPGATPSKKGRPEGMPKKRYQKAGLFSNTYKEEE